MQVAQCFTRHYGDIKSDQTYNFAFHEKLEPIQCNAAL